MRHSVCVNVLDLRFQYSLGVGEEKEGQQEQKASVADVCCFGLVFLMLLLMFGLIVVVV